MQESSLLGLEGTSKVGDNAKEVLRLQHFSTATRLCDITVNSLVALYFVFDCDGKDDVPGCAYIYEKKNEIKFDSAEMGVLLSINAGELDTVSEIEDRLVRNGTPMKRADIDSYY